MLSASPKPTKMTPGILLVRGLCPGWIPTHSANVATNFQHVVATGGENEVPEIAPIATKNLIAGSWIIYLMRNRPADVVSGPDVGPPFKKVNECLWLSFDIAGVMTAWRIQTMMQTASALKVQLRDIRTSIKKEGKY